MIATVRLLPNNKRLKQVIAEHGSVWVIITSVSPMQCFDNRDGVMVESLDKLHRRNVETTDIEDIT